MDAKVYCAVLTRFFKENQKVGPVGAKPRVPWVFMQDNAPCHRAKIVQKVFKKFNVQVLPWPANSPYLNPIENLWAWLNKKVYEKGNFNAVDHSDSFFRHSRPLGQPFLPSF
jgi:hypothetical protein